MTPLFSIILPTYNRAHVIWKAVQSAIAQSEPSWELIVVDDGSTDCTVRLLEEFHEPRLRVTAQDRHGPSAARNHGLALARAPFVAYIDSDNTWHADFLAVMRDAIGAAAGSVLWYCGQHLTLWERTRAGRWTRVREQAIPRTQYTLDDVWRLNGADTNCIVHRRAVAAAVGGWDERCRWLEDWDFFARVCLRYPGQVTWVPRILVEYRQVHGTGADGICGEAREDRLAEVAGRQYLRDKWLAHLPEATVARLTVAAADLRPVRAGDSG